MYKLYTALYNYLQNCDYSYATYLYLFSFVRSEVGAQFIIIIDYSDDAL